MKASETGIALIKKYEGCKLTAYQCPAKIWTIGWGNTTYLDGSKVKKGDKVTQEQADELFSLLLPKYEKMVARNLKIKVNQNQFDALVSFGWNNWYSERLFQLVNSRALKPDLQQWWRTHYITGGGVVLKGLVKRRREESELYFKA